MTRSGIPKTKEGVHEDNQRSLQLSDTDITSVYELNYGDMVTRSTYRGVASSSDQQMGESRLG